MRGAVACVLAVFQNHIRDAILCQRLQDLTFNDIIDLSIIRDMDAPSSQPFSREEKGLLVFPLHRERQGNTWRVREVGRAAKSVMNSGKITKRPHLLSV